MFAHLRHVACQVLLVCHVGVAVAPGVELSVRALALGLILTEIILMIVKHRMLRQQRSVLVLSWLSGATSAFGALHLLVEAYHIIAYAV